MVADHQGGRHQAGIKNLRLVAQQKADIAIWWPIIKAAGIKQQ
jgi:hypothetical protein